MWKEIKTKETYEHCSYTPYIYFTTIRLQLHKEFIYTHTVLQLEDVSSHNQMKTTMNSWIFVKSEALTNLQIAHQHLYGLWRRSTPPIMMCLLLKHCGHCFCEQQWGWQRPRSTGPQCRRRFWRRRRKCPWGPSWWSRRRRGHSFPSSCVGMASLGTHRHDWRTPPPVSNAGRNHL